MVKLLLNRIGRWSLGAGLCSLAGLASAIVYRPAIDQARWDVDASPLECRLSQSIPAFGQGSFSHRAGQPLLFALTPFQPMYQVASVNVAVQTPPWKPEAGYQLLSQTVTDDRQPLTLEGNYAQMLMEAIGQGYETLFTAMGGEQFGSTEVTLSPVNFLTAYQAYQQCLSQLLPVNFDQIARSAIFFGTNQQGFSDEVEQQLSLIARYVNADDRIGHIYIDGHTDNQGDKNLNVSLSRARAQMVADFLVDHGVTKSLLVTRYHADKYPVMDNETADGRARNRRVTIRLERN